MGRKLITALTILPVLLATACMLGAPPSEKLPPQVATAEAHAVSESAWPLVEKHCVTCHNGTLKIGGVEFDRMDPKALGDQQFVEAVLR